MRKEKFDSTVCMDLNSAIHKVAGLRATLQNTLQRPFLLAAPITANRHFSIPQELYQAKLGSREACGFVNSPVSQISICNGINMILLTVSPMFVDLLKNEFARMVDNGSA